jgi:hypothetical protein
MRIFAIELAGNGLVAEVAATVEDGMLGKVDIFRDVMRAKWKSGTEP